MNCQTPNCCHKIEFGSYCEDCKFDAWYSNNPKQKRWWK